MSEIGDCFDALAALKRVKKLVNAEQSKALLVSQGVKFESKNEGLHLIVTGKAGLIDFWPSTGKFKPRGTAGFKRGVFQLLKLCEVGV